LEQARKIPGIHKLICAYPYGEEQQPIADIIANTRGVVGFVGDENNVVARYFVAASQHRLDIIVRITGDCPFFNPMVGQTVINLMRQKWDEVDYVSNVHPARTFPKGFDCEVFKMSALDAANRNTTSEYDREHVTPWIVRNKRTACIAQSYDCSYLNLCIDTQEDLDRLQMVAANFDFHQPTGFAKNAV